MHSVAGTPRLRYAGAVASQWTIRRLLAWTGDDFAGRGIETARLDAEILLAHSLGIERIALYLDLDRPLAQEELDTFRAFVGRRRRREPIAYLVGARDFYGRAFAVSPAVLIPRPDTETLVDRALTLLPAAESHRVLDLCTGSGIIAISLAVERPELEADASDLSPEALAVAADNAEAHGVAERVHLHEGDLFEALIDAGVGQYDLVAANPPYIEDAEVPTLMADVADFEPHLALAGGPDGFVILRRLIADVAPRLRPGGHLLLEVGAGQAPAVAEMLAAKHEFDEVTTHKDLGGIERVVEARRATD